MNKEETMKALAEGHKLRHRYFGPTEYIYQDGKEIVHEDGARMSIKDFWAIRDGGLAWDMDWSIYNNPIILQSLEMIVSTHIYRDEFLFQRMQKDHRWYVTYKNYIIAYGVYRHDLEEWIDIYYPPKRVSRVKVMREIKQPPSI